DTVLGASPRLRYRALDRAVHRRRPSGRGRVALSGAPQARGARPHSGRMGHHGAQPAREVLSADSRREKAARVVARLLGPVRRRRLQGPRDRAHALIPPVHDPQQAPAPNAERAATWRRYLRFWGPRAEADVDDELSFHLEMRARDYMERGMTELEARRAAARRLGDLASARAECIAITSRRERRMTRSQIIDAFVHDVTFAWRTLGRQKGWTAVAIATLALGIGANTAVFSVVNTLLLHPIPYPNADRVAFVYQEPTEGNNTGMRGMVTPQPLGGR